MKIIAIPERNGFYQELVYPFDKQAFYQLQNKYVGLDSEYFKIFANYLMITKKHVIPLYCEILFCRFSCPWQNILVL